MPSCGAPLSVCVCVSSSGRHTILVFPCQTAWQYSDWDPPNGWGRQKSGCWAHLVLMLAVSAATCQVLSTGSPVDDGHRDKKFRRYAKYNRTAHLTACSDKSVAYVTNNKRLYSTFCTVEANYWQTRSIARPLCDSWATCNNSFTVVFSDLLLRTGGIKTTTSPQVCCRITLRNLNA